MTVITSNHQKLLKDSVTDPEFFEASSALADMSQDAKKLLWLPNPGLLPCCIKNKTTKFSNLKFQRLASELILSERLKTTL